MIKKIGRPREYAPSLADKVMADVICGKSYRTVAFEHGISLAMVQRIVADDRRVVGGDNGI